MDEEKYYWAQPEDFRVGFECEVNWSCGYSDKFEPFKAKICDDLPGGMRDCYTSNLDDAIEACDDGYAAFRVPYLTPEDVESLGWKLEDTSFFSKEKDENTTYQLGLHDNHIISINENRMNGWAWTWSSSFRGTCRCKNDLKLIMKLLNIK